MTAQDHAGIDHSPRAVSSDHPPRAVSSDRPPRAVSFDLFGTLIEVRPPPDPASAVGTALRERGVSVPADWQTRYRTPQRAAETESGVETSLYDHVEAALTDGTEHGVDRGAVEAAVDEAFDPAVETVPGAESVVRRVGEQVPVGVLSNSSLPGLVEEALDRSTLSRSAFDAVVTSVDCGWRKPHARAFERVAASLDTAVPGLMHVGDDPETDGGIVAANGRFHSVQETSLESVPAALEDPS